MSKQLQFNNTTIEAAAEDPINSFEFVKKAGHSEEFFYSTALRCFPSESGKNQRNASASRYSTTIYVGES